MKKFFIPILLITHSVYCNYSYAQTVYKIPGATKQPAWVFPIWFEEGTGQRDTIYLGYDSASDPFGQGDTIFGEKYYPLDTNRFNAAWYIYNNTARKISVRKSDFFFSIEFYKATLPLKMSWDLSLFRSDSMPFPDQDPAPRAQAELWGGDDRRCSIQYYPVLLTDSSNMPCRIEDSIRIFEFYGNMTLTIEPWTGLITSTTKISLKSSDVKIYPIPSSDNLFIEIPKDEFLFYTVVDIFGRQCKQGNGSGGEKIVLILSDLPNGVYFIHLKIINNYSIRKVVKIK